MKTQQAGRVYTGEDRRIAMDRRSGLERRNLVRYESIGSDRRLQPYRRKEESFWITRGA